MFDLEISSNDRIKEGNFFSHQNIGSFPFKGFMLLLSHNKNNITGFFHWVLIGLSMEGVLFTVWGTFIDTNLNDLFLFMGDVTIALFDNSISIDSNLHILAIV